MNCGQIKWISPDASHGFILLPDGQEAYFNAYDIIGGDISTVSLGEQVSFDLLRTHKGFEAFNIQAFAFA